MATELEAARLLVYQAAWAHDCGAGDSKLKSSMAKLFATEAAQRIVDQALQIHGGMGVVVGSVVERLYRDVRALRIYEGTSEIQKIVIARELAGEIEDRGLRWKMEDCDLRSSIVHLRRRGRTMDFELSEELTAVRDLAREFAEKEIAPTAAKDDKEHNFRKDLAA